MDDQLVDLQFQDFSAVHSAPTSNAGGGGGSKNASVKKSTTAAATTFHFTEFPGSPDDDDDPGKGSSNNAAANNNSSNKSDGQSPPSFWTFAYYQRFFDVDTDLVSRRIINGTVPRCGTNFILNHIRPSPDLYGPWWISVTLIFAIAIASNLEGYFTSAVGGKDDYHWSLEFGVVTAAAAAIFAYVWLVPLILYGVFWWRKSEESFSFAEILCAYGYSLSIYIPIALLWVIPSSWFQWLLICVGVSSSGTVLVISLWPAVRHDQRMVSFLIMVAIVAVNALLAIGFKTVFFHVAGNTAVRPSNVTQITPSPIIPQLLPKAGVLTPSNATS